MGARRLAGWLAWHPTSALILFQPQSAVIVMGAITGSGNRKLNNFGTLQILNSQRELSNLFGLYSSVFTSIYCHPLFSNPDRPPVLLNLFRVQLPDAKQAGETGRSTEGQPGGPSPGATTTNIHNQAKLQQQRFGLG